MGRNSSIVNYSSYYERVAVVWSRSMYAEKQRYAFGKNINENIEMDQWCESSSFVYHHNHIVNSVCCSHALVSGPTSKRPASDGGRCDSNR